MAPRSSRLLALCSLLIFSFSCSAVAQGSEPTRGSNWSVDYDSTNGDRVAWTIRGDAPHQLRLLRVASATDVVVALYSSLQSGDDFAVAKIVAVTDGGRRDIFDDDIGMFGLHVDVNSDGELELVVDDGPRQPLYKVLLHVAHGEVLGSVAAHGSGSIFIHGDVLGNCVALLASGTGDVLVKTDHPLSLQSLKLTSYGSGNVKIDSTSTVSVREDVALTASSAGDVEIRSTTLEAAAVNVVAHGNGDVYVSASSRLSAKTLSLEAAGSGDITFASNNGQCEREWVRLMGSSDVATGDVMCQDVRVTSSGSGDVVVHAVDRLDMSVYSSGSVKYAGDRPAHVTLMSPSSRSHHAKHVGHIEEPRTPHIENPHPPKESRDVDIHGGDVDIRSPRSHIHIEANGGDDSDSEQIWDDDDDNDTDEDRLGFLSLAKTSGSTTTLQGVGVVAAVAVVGVAVVATVVARRRMAGYETIPLTV